MNNIRESATAEGTRIHQELENRIPLQEFGINQTLGPLNPKSIPLARLRFRHRRLTKLFTNLERQRKPGILDQIQTCESREAAHLLWHEFLDSANAVSQKTINKATRLLETIDFPLP